MPHLLEELELKISGLQPDRSPEARLGDACGFSEEEIRAAQAIPVEFEAVDLEEAEEQEYVDRLGMARVDAEALVIAGSGIDDVFHKLPRELRRHGLDVRTIDGWRERGRPGPVTYKAVTLHHTASNKDSGPAPALNICVHGRPDLAGPLCQIHIARDCTVTVIAAGRANHAGEGGPLKGIPADSANAYAVGIEVENNGIGEKWSEKLRRTIGIVVAILLRRMKRRARMCFGHKEWTTRKIDPFGINMDAFRKRVRKLLRKMRSKR